MRAVTCVSVITHTHTHMQGMFWGLVSQITGPFLTPDPGTVGKCSFSSLGLRHWEAASRASAQLILGLELCVWRGKHS